LGIGRTWLTCVDRATESWNTEPVARRRDDEFDTKAERRSTVSARDRAKRRRADRRHREQPLSSLGIRVDEALADELESRTHHRRPVAARTPDPPSLGRTTVDRSRRRRELIALTGRHGAGRIDFAALEGDDSVER
jgi:hypothetical protein